MRRKSHTTRSWSIRLSDSSASCTQFWMTVPIPLPATFDLRCPAHNYRWLHDDCHLVPNSMRLLLLFHPEAPKVRAVCFWPPSFNKDVCHNLASVSLGGAQNALHHGFWRVSVILIRAISSTSYTVRYRFPPLWYLSLQRERWFW